MNIASAVILCTIVGAVGAIILVAAAKFMAVEEDPRIEEVASCLAGANCGGCGYAGCADYAKAVVMDGVPCDKCAPGGPKAAAAIAKIMGGEASAVEKKAVVQCQGSSEHCKPAYDYKGIQTCAAAATLYGGPKTCSFACIGLGDCTKVCKFDAIHIVDGVAKVDKDKCTGCGACANICPKKAIMIDAGYNYERLAGKMVWPGIAPQSIRHILITHQDTDWKTSRFRRCRKRCKGIRGSAVTLGSDHVQCVLQCADNGGGMAYKSSSVFR